MEVPRDARGHRDGALETLRMLGGGQIAEIAARQPDEGIEHEHHAALVLAREFAHGHAAKLGRHLPIDEARAIGRQILAQRMKFVPAPPKMAGHFAAQQRQNFVELIGRLDPRIHDDLR